MRPQRVWAAQPGDDTSYPILGAATQVQALLLLGADAKLRNAQDKLPLTCAVEMVGTTASILTQLTAPSQSCEC